MKPILAVEGLSKKFGGLAAVNQVSFAVESGEILGAIGPNGAGKTTLLNLISNLYVRNSGKILYGGEDIGGKAPNEIARMGLVRTFQSTVSYGESTVWENMIRAQLGYHFQGLCPEFLMTRSVREKKKIQESKAEELLQFLGLKPWRDAQARALPYGYQKLLGLAIALAGDPKLLMLDEPAAGLNHDERRHLMDAIQKINAKGVSVILVEHDMKVIMGLCGRILVLNYGQKIALGTPTEIQRNEEVIKAYLGEDLDLA
ncbi:MAG TPA: ABC transporter ATP-binding protein [Thermodesulfobacteriota bacterium]|nr:ABC transporter ATP-binding protein [Thermodesulfobacteriota bacterium]